MPLSVLVTGGAGFIGSNLVRRLLERGDRVRVLDNLSTGRLANLEPLRSDVEVVEGDIRRADRVNAVSAGIDVVFHQAAMTSVTRSIEEPVACTEVNVLGTLNVLIAARERGVGRVVLASSSSTYGNGAELPRREDQRPDPRSPYAVSKLAAEQLGVTFARLHGLETVALRYFNVYGPGQDGESPYAAVVPRFLLAVSAGTPVTIYGDGTQSRDFTFVDDVVDANLLAADSVLRGGAVVNVAAGRSWTVDALADAVGRALGRDVERRYLEARPGDARRSWADITAARALLGYEPRVPLEDGLAFTAESLAAAALTR